jgi:hypothetical protein
MEVVQDASWQGPPVSDQTLSFVSSWCADRRMRSACHGAAAIRRAISNEGLEGD